MSAPRPCGVEGCGGFAQGGSRCAAHQAERDRYRARRYGVEHKRWRRWWRRAIEDGHRVDCAICGQPVGRQFDLHHMRDGSEAPTHPACNRAEPRRGAPR
jgi:hypothetical protein